MKFLALMLLASIFSTAVMATTPSYDSSAVECSRNGRNIEITLAGEPIMSGNRLLPMTAMSWHDQCEMVLRQAREANAEVYILGEQLSLKPRQGMRTCVCKTGPRDRSKKDVVVIFFNAESTLAQILEKATNTCKEVFHGPHYEPACRGLLF